MPRDSSFIFPPYVLFQATFPFGSNFTSQMSELSFTPKERVEVAIPFPPSGVCPPDPLVKERPSTLELPSLPVPPYTFAHCTLPFTSVFMASASASGFTVPAEYPETKNPPSCVCCTYSANSSPGAANTSDHWMLPAISVFNKKTSQVPAFTVPPATTKPPSVVC